MKKLSLVLVLFVLPFAAAYSFTFSADSYNITEMHTFAWANTGNTTFRWYGYRLNTSDYLYWAGILVSSLGNCTFNNEIALIDGGGKKFYVNYGEGPGANGTLYLLMFEPDLYSRHYNLSRGPYTFNISLTKSEGCEVIVKKFVFVTSKVNPGNLPLKLVSPPGKEPAIRSFEFANKTYWREFELNFTYIYRGGNEDVLTGWKSEPCPILSIHDGKVCLAEKYCECHEENTTLSPGIYRVGLKFRRGNLSVRILGNGIAFEKSIHVRHPIYLASLSGIYGDVSFSGVGGNASELFETPGERYGNLTLAIAIVIAIVVAIRWRR